MEFNLRWKIFREIGPSAGTKDMKHSMAMFLNKDVSHWIWDLSWKICMKCLLLHVGPLFSIIPHVGYVEILYDIRYIQIVFQVVE